MYRVTVYSRLVAPRAIAPLLAPGFATTRELHLLFSVTLIGIYPRGLTKGRWVWTRPKEELACIVGPKVPSLSVSCVPVSRTLTLSTVPQSHRNRGLTVVIRVAKVIRTCLTLRVLRVWHRRTWVPVLIIVRGLINIAVFAEDILRTTLSILLWHLSPIGIIHWLPCTEIMSLRRHPEALTPCITSLSWLWTSPLAVWTPPCSLVSAWEVALVTVLGVRTVSETRRLRFGLGVSVQNRLLAGRVLRLEELH